MEVPQEIKIELSQDAEIQILDTEPKNWKQVLKDLFVHSCSWQYYSQQSNVEATKVSIDR